MKILSWILLAVLVSVAAGLLLFEKVFLWFKKNPKFILLGINPLGAARVVSFSCGVVSWAVSRIRWILGWYPRRFRNRKWAKAWVFKAQPGSKGFP